MNDDTLNFQVKKCHSISNNVLKDIVILDYELAAFNASKMEYISVIVLSDSIHEYAPVPMPAYIEIF